MDFHDWLFWIVGGIFGFIAIQMGYQWKYPDRREENVIMILDRAGAHCSKKLCLPEGVVLEYLPPYCPELNPAERFFQELRKEPVNKIFESLDELEWTLTRLPEHYW